MSKSPEKDPVKPDLPLPPHPFFKCPDNQASFIDCIDAIDRVRAMIVLNDAIDLEDYGALSPDAAFGFYWTTELTRGTLSYVSKRLMMLEHENSARQQRESDYLSALIKSLPSLGRDNRERFLNTTAGELNMKRSALDKFVCKRGKQ